MSAKSRTLVWLFVIALGLRLLFVVTRGPDIFWPDSRDYHSIAENLLEGKGFIEAEGRRGSRAPGYPLFLAGCYAAGLRDPRAIYALQAVAGAAMCVLVVMLGHRLFGRDSRAGICAGWIAAVYPFFIYFTGLMLAESLFMLGFVGYLVLIACREPNSPAPEAAETERSEPTLSRAVAAGALAGVLSLLRSSFLLFPVFMVPFWFRQVGSYSRALRSWLVMMAVMVLVILPWGIRNYHVFGHFIPTTLQVGESLYEANSPHADGGPAMDRIDWVKERGSVMMDEYENNRFFKTAAVEYIRKNPRRFAWLALEKLRRFWNVVPNHGPYRSPFYATISVCSYVPILLLAILGIVWTRSRGRAMWLLAAPVLYFSLLHMVFVGSIRYRVPVMPFVILFAGVGVEALRRQWRSPAEGIVDAGTEAASPKRRRKWFLWAGITLLVISGSLLAAWRHFVTPERLRLAAQKRLSAIAGGAVDIREVEVGLFKGVVLRGVRVEDNESEMGRPALRVDTVVLQPNWSSLLRGDMVLVGMRLEDVQVDARLDASGHWPFLDQLQLSGDGTARLPAVFISRVRLRVSRLPDWLGIRSLNLSRLNATVRPVTEDPDLYDLVLWSDETKLGRPRITTRFSIESRAVQGSVRLSGLDLTSPLLRELMPENLGRVWDKFGASKGKLETEARFAWNPVREEPFTVSGNAYLRDLWFQHERFPHPIEKVSLDLSFDEQSLRVGRFKGMVGQTELLGGGDAQLRGADKVVWQATLRAKDIKIDQDLYALLPDTLQGIWDRIHPAGAVNLSLSMNSNPAEAEPKLRAQVELLDCAFAFDALPVPFKGIRGRLHIDGRRLAMRGIEGLAGGARFSLRDGFVVMEDQGPFLVGGEVHDLQFASPCIDMIPPMLLIAAPELVRRGAAGGNLAGKWNLSATLRRDVTAGKIDARAALVLKEGSFSHPDLPLPLTNIQAAVRYAKGAIKVEGFSASWGDGQIEVPATTISLLPGGAQNIRISGGGFPLNDALYRVVPASVKRVWDQLDPAGFADITIAYVRQAGETGKMHRTIRVDFRDGAVRYKNFSYAVSGISGRVLFEDRPLKYAELQGMHDSTPVKVGVYEEPLGEVAKTRVVVDAKGVPLDKDLRDALPVKYHEWWDAFHPEGFVDVKYVSAHELADEGVVIPKVTCDVTADDLALATRLAVKLTGVSVAIKQTGRAASGQSRLTGKMHVAGAQIDRYLLDQFNGVIEGEGTSLFLDGASAKCYDGDLTGSASMVSSVAEDGKKTSLFEITLNLSGADAAALAQANEIEGLSGNLNATTDISITTGADQGFAARGALAIRDGAIGELPGMMKVINLFRLRGFDAPAFHSIELTYAIVEGTFHAYELNVLGKILSLYGNGTVNSDKEMDLTFSMRLGPRVNIPGITALWESLKEQTVPITVQGDLNDPVWRMNPLISIARLVQGTLGKLIPGKGKPQE